MNNTKHNAARPEIWAGMECTINRVGDQYSDQMERTGQYESTDDLLNICKLGISKLRFPILWERHYNNPSAWEHTSKQLELLNLYAVVPIAGLLHHGSGPPFTNLSDQEFPELFAAYAKEVATAYPQIKYYTPINEPLTTARFSGLYGFWYPHEANELTFASIFLNQLKAIVLAMQAIRSINPDAALIQTEDLCKVYSTQSLQYQADFENERRWWTNDILTSRVSQSHAAWNYFTGIGIPAKDLEFFLTNTCIPAVAGFNYYVTSERYLDDNLQEYSPAFTGGNGRDRYVDTEAVRKGQASGLKNLLTEAWERYHIPLAVTECHISCTREQQLRWLDQQWKVVRELNENDVSVVAITPWALLGAYDWNSLVTQKKDHYESGAFIRNAGVTVPTALMHMIRAISVDEEYDHPALQGKGWWEDDNAGIERDVRPLVVMDEPALSAYLNQRFPEVIPVNHVLNLREVITSSNAWAVVTRIINEEIEQICAEQQVPVLLLPDVCNIHEKLDLFIDQQAEAICANNNPGRSAAKLTSHHVL